MNNFRKIPLHHKRPRWTNKRNGFKGRSTAKRPSLPTPATATGRHPFSVLPQNHPFCGSKCTAMGRRLTAILTWWRKEHVQLLGAPIIWTVGTKVERQGNLKPDVSEETIIPKLEFGRNLQEREDRENIDTKAKMDNTFTSFFSFITYIAIRRRKSD